LLNQGFNPNESQTKGILINDWEVVDINHCEIETDDQKITTHLWDFGGQEFMHATHQFFLSKRSLYILILDGRKDEKTEYWLKYIESFGANSPVLIVLNKIDQNPAFKLNYKHLRNKYNNIQGFYRLSCSNEEGIEDFKIAFQQALSKIEIRHNTWPTTWFNVKTQLEQMAEPYIDYSNYIQICQTAQVTETKAQEVLIEYLCDLGIVLYFTELELADTHVLEPKWLTKAVYKIINNRKVTDNYGTLNFSDLPAILKPTDDGDYNYKRNQYPYIIGLMKKFELCYSLKEQQVLIPDLLPIEEPEFDITQGLQFRIDYDFLPKSIMPRFIVKSHDDIKNELHWRTGVVLHDKAFGATAVVKSDDEAKKIFINIIGTKRRDYLVTILKTFRTINDSFEKLGDDERVCLPDNPDVTVSLEHLYYLEEKGEIEYIPEGAKHAYSVKELLGDIVNESATNQWFDILPAPLASILWRYSATNDNSQKVEQLLNFFEALAEFLVMLMASALQEKVLDNCPKPTFGDWNSLINKLAKQTRDLMNAKQSNESFGNPSPEFLQFITNKQLWQLLEEVRIYRNDKARGIISEIEHKNLVVSLETKLTTLRKYISTAFTDCRLIAATTITYSNNIFTCKVKELIGTRTPFNEVEIKSAIPLATDKLYLVHGKNKPIELLPLIKYQQDACYFYNRIEGEKIRWVSYHYEQQAEIYEDI